MDWAQIPRVLLVWPPEARVLQEKLDLILLERYCTSLGSQLALVTKDPLVRSQAREIGLPVFSSRSEAQTQPWRKSWRVFRRKNLIEDAAQPRELELHELRPLREKVVDLPQWARLGIFSTGVLAVLTFALLLLPQAVITIPPQKQLEKLVVPVQASPVYQDVQVSGLLPAREITLSLQKTGQTSATGTQRVPDEYASGQVLFRNLTDHTVSLPQGTLVSTSGEDAVRYQTQADLTIPAGPGTEGSVQVQAVEPGSQGNQPSAVIQEILTEAGADLLVVNPRPITGGSVLSVPAPNEADREQLSQDLLAELQQEADREIRSRLGPRDLLLHELPSLEEMEVLEQYPPAGSPGKILEMTLKGDFSSLIVEGPHLEDLAQEIAQTSTLPTGYQPLMETLDYTQFTDPILISEDTAQWSLKLSWQKKPISDRGEITRMLLGRRPSQAVEILKDQLALDQDPEIVLQPAWWFSLPLLPFRIEIQ